MQIIGKMLSPSIKYTYQVISKCLATHPNFYVLVKLGNMIRVPILNPNFSIKHDLKNLYQELKGKMFGLR